MRIFAIGNALVDQEFRVSDTELDAMRLTKGHMALIDEQTLGAKCAALGEPMRRCGGGSAANTAAAFVGFGGEAYFCGRVADDDVGQWFISDLQSYGVDTQPAPHTDAGTSGQCLVLISDDAERTMLTFLGVSAELRQQDLNEAALANADLVYVEGYMAGSDVCTDTCLEALTLARTHRLDTALTLSDASMVEFCRSNLERMLEGGVTHLFCNLEEALLLTGSDRLDDASILLGEHAQYLHITLGAHGSLCQSQGAQARASAPPSTSPNAAVVDTTGAGDMYAGAVLQAYASGGEAAAMAAFGNFAASGIVRHYGARLSARDAYAALRTAFADL